MRLPNHVLLSLAVLTISALAVHQKNAGPEDVELKFKLPPPVPLSPEEELKTFKVEKGFRVELVACEPMIESPIAMSFDDQGRLYVCEMRGYMHDMNGAGEKEPTGRVSLLEDTDGDGRMDKATAFLDKVVMPRAVMAVNGGALIAVPPNLFFCKDTDGDGVADVKDVVATDFGTLGGQPEHMANSPVWAMDNAIWSAGYSTRFKLRGGVWQKDSGLGRGQWGLCQDNFGKLYFNYNSDMLRADLLPTEAFTKNPLLRNATSINAKLAADQTLYASHPTPGVNRGYDAKSLSSDGRLTKPTATCGALIYRGDAFPAAYRGNAFVPEPAANLVKRFTMSESGGIDADTLQRTLPVSLGRLFQIQLSSLSPSERQVVEASAIIGTPFLPASIAALTNQSERDAEDTLRKLLAGGQLVHRADLLNRTYQLAHELLRQAVYDAIGESRKTELHSSYADALIASTNVDRSVLAHHFTLAERWAEAIEAHVAAAHTSRDTHAALECIDHLEAAIDLSRRHAVFPPRDDWLYSVHENLYSIYRTTHGYTRPRVHELVNEIAHLGGTSANLKIRCKSLSVQIGHAMMCGRVPWGLERSAELDKLTAELGEPGRLVEANSLLGEANLYAGNLQEALERLGRCQELLATMPGSNSARWDSGVHRLLALVQVELGQFPAACLSVEQGLAKAATPFQQAMCLYNGYSVHALQGDFTGGEPYVARLESIVRQYDFMEIEIWASMTRAMVTVETGDPETALRLTLAGRRLLEEGGTNLFRGLVHMAEGRARARLGDAKGAYRTLDEGSEIARRQGEFGCLANVLFTRGEIGLWLNRSEAHDDLVAALEQARRNGSLLWQVRDLAFLATVDPSRLPELKKLLQHIDAVPVDVRRIAGQSGLDLS